MASHRDLICVFNLNFTISFAENSMDQDGGYSKQQIGSLTTEGEGESQILKKAQTCLEYSKAT